MDRLKGLAIVGLLGTAIGTSSAGDTSQQSTHEMSGTVRALDAETGTVWIAVAGMDDLQLHLPASELANFHEGDRVTVSIGVHKGSDDTGDAR